MSVLIKGMEKPRVCAECPFREVRYNPGCYNDEHCSALNKIFNECRLDIDPYKERLSDCPLIEIPTSHGRLIDVDMLFEAMGLDTVKEVMLRNCKFTTAWGVPIIETEENSDD